MATTIEYALLAGASYYDTRRGLNRFPLPKGWNWGSRIPQDKTTGFEAAAFCNGADLVHSTEIIISYAGTGPGWSDWIRQHTVGAGQLVRPTSSGG